MINLVYFWWLDFLKLVKITKNNKSFLKNFAKIYNVFIHMSRNFKLVEFANNSGRTVFQHQPLALPKDINKTRSFL